MSREVIFNNGYKMPIVGLGTSQCYGEEIKSAVRIALNAGYRHIDTASRYDNESEIGMLLHEYLTNGRLRREELFITTKLPMIHMDAHNVRRSLDESLERLKVTYIDLYLIHAPYALQLLDGDIRDPEDENGKPLCAHETDFTKTWEAMEDLVDNGKVKSIGVSNFNSEQVDRVVRHARIKPVVNQVECNAYFPQEKLRKFCEMRGVHLTAFAPLGSAGRPSVMERDDVPTLLDDPCISEIAKQYKKTSAQILLRNLIQRGMSVIPKSVNPERIKENLQVFDFELTDSDMKKIADLKNYERLFTYSSLKDHPEYPFNIPY